MVRLILFFTALSLAAVSDMKCRSIPNWMTCLVALVSLIPPGHPGIAGLLVCLPLFIAGITAGGIGGGDIKLTAACGLVLGFDRAFTGLSFALCLLVVWHVMRTAAGKIRRKETENGRGQAYPLVPFLWIGMLFSVILFRI